MKVLAENILMPLLNVRYLLLCFILTNLPVTGFGQYFKINFLTQDFGSHFNIYKYDYESGLPIQRVNKIYQDSKGYIWMTSYDGIVRYDGFEFHHYDSYNDSTLSGSSFYDISEDNEGNIWFSSSRDGLVSFKNNAFESYGKELGINTLFEIVFADSKNRIWTGAAGKGCFYLQNGEFHFPVQDPDFLNAGFMTICEDKNGMLYFGSFGNGLFAYNGDDLYRYDNKNGLNSNIITALHCKNNFIYIGTDNGVFVFDGMNFYQVNESQNTTIYGFLEDDKGNIYYTNHSGLFLISCKEDFTEKNFDSRLIFSARVHSGIFDSDNNLWFIHIDAGIYSIKKNSFINLTEMTGLSGTMVNAVCEIYGGSVLVGLNNGKINIIQDHKISEFHTKMNLDNSRIRHIMEDSERNIWISTYEGLLKIRKDGKEKWYSYSTGFPASKIRFTFEDSKGNIWVGTRDKGLIKIFGKDNNQFKIVTGCSEHTTILSVDEDSQNRLLIGTSGSGLLIISENGDILQKYDIKTGFKSNIVFNTYIDDEGVVWVAANGGLFRIKDGSVSSFTVKDGFLTDSPYDIVEDSVGTFWIPYNKGIIKVNKKELNQFADKKVEKIKLEVFDKEEGIRGEGLNSTCQSILTSSGHIMIPARYGLVILDPEDLSVKNVLSDVFIERFTYNNRNYSIDDTTVLKEGKGRYTFKYTAVNYLAPEKLRFRYKLLGYDDTWTYVESQIREISYTNLPPGEYVFEISASSKDGKWDMKGARKVFVIEPVWYHAVWFKILILIAAFLIFWLIYKFRIRQLKRNERSLEQKVNERTKELKLTLDIVKNQKDEIETQKEELMSLNEMKDKLFSIIAHDLKAPFGSVLVYSQQIKKNVYDLEKEEIENSLNMISQSLEKGFNLLENLLEWARYQLGKTSYSPELIEIYNMIEDIVSLLKPVADRKEISLEIKLKSDLLVYADQNMFNTIIRNLISNSVKFTERGGKVVIDAKENDNFVEISVTDNGVGISKENLEKILDGNTSFSTFGTENEKGTGLGISLVKEFVQMNSGLIDIRSELGKGSTFKVLLPSKQFN